MPDDKDAKKVEADHAKTGKPVSPTEDPTDHSIGGGKAAAAAAQAKVAEEDNTIGGKLARSGLFFVRDHSVGTEYIGESPQNDPKASEATKLRSLVHPIAGVAPRTGMQIRLKDGTNFSVGDGFGPDSTPADWAKVTKPDGKPLFA